MVFFSCHQAFKKENIFLSVLMQVSCMKSSLVQNYIETKLCGFSLQANYTDQVTTGTTSHYVKLCIRTFFSQHLCLGKHSPCNSLLHLVHTLLALHLLTFVLQTMHWDSFFSGSFLSLHGHQRSSTPVFILQHQPLLPKLSIMDTVYLDFSLPDPL
jgi:hypothetical protein